MFDDMSRVLRSQCPGGIFHLTARTQGKERWFVPILRPRIAETIVDGVCSSGSCLIAYAVMPNHFHIVVAQGTRTLGWMMKPICHRVALMIQRHHGVEGHVFERRFFSKQCRDAEYARTVIHYTHYNPVKAGLCASIGEYAWTSHGQYVAPQQEMTGIKAQDVLQLFSCDLARTTRNLEEARECYNDHAAWWCRKQVAEAADEEFVESPPRSPGGDEYFMKHYATPVQQLTHPPARDLRDAALLLRDRIAPDMDMRLLRRPHGGRRAVEIRRQIVAALHSSGYRNVSIANYLNVHPSVVARVVSAIRWGRAER